jgi:hypothetical protein
VQTGVKSLCDYIAKKKENFVSIGDSSRGSGWDDAVLTQGGTVWARMGSLVAHVACHCHSYTHKEDHLWFPERFRRARRVGRKVAVSFVRRRRNSAETRDTCPAVPNKGVEVNGSLCSVSFEVLLGKERVRTRENVGGVSLRRRAIAENRGD